MSLKDVNKWNARACALYAAGIWTMIGTYVYTVYKGAREGEPGKKEEVQVPENTNQVIYETPHSKTIIIYKKDFVPYTTRIYNFIKSFSSEPGSGDANK
ncbi:small integral membrane protein 26-like [Chaetodon trifascialis]|uniref:small integral membrane protein 26-like n=1 Tax=Chaetodon trifascialis TaxID=109706 RepID=UPI00399522C6